jgi:hypothetical protein
MGLLVRYQNERNFYLFNVAANGFYNLERFDNGTWQTIINWTPSSAIRGEGQPNTLRVVTSDDRIGLFVNGIWLEEARDRAFASGQVGLAVKTFERGGATVTFTDLLITGP